MKILFSLLICSLLLAKLDAHELHSHSQIKRYTVHDLKTLGGVTTVPTAMNNRGELAGVATFVNIPGHIFITHAFFYSNGKIRDLGALSGGTSRATALNDKGQVIGMATISSDPDQEHPFLYQNGRMYDLWKLGQPKHIADKDNRATSINNKGEIVGTMGAYEGFLYSNGKLRFLPFANPVHINNKGQIVANDAVGYVQARGYALLYQKGKTIHLDALLKGRESHARDINDAGEVVGGWTTRDGKDHAFLYSKGKMLDLSKLVPAIGLPAHTEVSTQALNNKGQVVGYLRFRGDDRR